MPLSCACNYPVLPCNFILPLQDDTSVVGLTVLCFSVDFCVVCTLCMFSYFKDW